MKDLLFVLEDWGDFLYNFIINIFENNSYFDMKI